MKIASTVLSAVLALSFALASPMADAKRLGGGKSTGKQSSNVTQQQQGAAPAGAGNTANSTTAAPANSAAAARPGTPAAAAAAPKKPWGAMLGGLAAGLGLAWLASSLGLGEAFGNILMFGLLALLVMVVAGFLIRKFRGGGNNSVNANRNANGNGANASPFAFQPAGGSAIGSNNVGNNPDMQPAMPRSYSPENVGNDASARPFERSSGMGSLAPAAGGSMIGSALLGTQSWGVPAGFDAEGFLTACKANFITLQAAWDRSDIQSLRAMMTDDMLAQIKTQLAERESHTGGVANTTDVEMIEAQLLGIEELSDSYMASVEFSGMIREDVSAGATSFREVWNMTKPRSGGGWLVAGVQALQ